MNPEIRMLLANDRLRAMQAEAAAFRLASRARHASGPRNDGRTDTDQPRIDVLRRLVARLAGA